jgi:hypothetical protein
MKRFTPLLPVLLLASPQSMAAINVPGADGSDGVLNITENTVIDLSQAVDGTWDQDNTANAGQGVYDAAQWAVVFKYSSVTVEAGATVSFSNHPSRAPVVWLVSGDVLIDGLVTLNGQGGVPAPALAEPGPGGFRGGTGYYSTGVGDGAGFGPGGGQRQAQGGSYGAGSRPYGNPSLLPLIGGSGGSGAARNSSHGGGAGGGAILIASTGTVTVNGTIRSNGGAGPKYYFDDRAGGGAGGGIRVVCDSLAGSGAIQALAGAGGRNLAASYGRIRLERAANSSTITVTPDPSVVPLTSGDTALVWPPAEAPTVRILTIGGEPVPADPRAAFGTLGADVALPETSTVPVVIETLGVEEASQVQVRLTPRGTTNFSAVDAVVSEVFTGTDPLQIHWTADVPVGNGYSAVQVKVVRP